MSTIFTFAIVALTISFFVGIICLKMSYERIIFKDSFSPILLLLSIGFIAVIEFTPLNYDTLSDFSINETFSILCSAIAIYIISSIRAIEKTTPLIILSTAILCSFFFPPNFLLFEGYLPPVLDKAAIISIWFMFSLCFKYLNGIDGIAGVQTCSIALGLIVLYFIGAAPLVLGLLSITLLGTILSLLIFNTYPSYLSLSNGACNSLGFIVAWLLIKLSQEQAGACALVLSLYFICECLFSIFQAALPQNKDKTIYKYTSYYQAVLNGMKLSDAVYSTLKITLLLIALSTFQAFSSNTYSITILSSLICIWFMHRFINWKEGTKTLKEINKDFVTDIKDNIGEIKKRISKDK